MAAPPGVLMVQPSWEGASRSGGSSSGMDHRLRLLPLALCEGRWGWAPYPVEGWRGQGHEATDQYDREHLPRPAPVMSREWLGIAYGYLHSLKVWF